MTQKFLLARKVKMTQLFDEEGNVHAGTILKMSPMVVTQVKSKEGKDAYSALQVGFETQKKERVAKAQRETKAYKVLKEFKTEDTSQTVGAEIKNPFSVGDVVEVSGETKGRGFAGVVKRHGFHGGRRTHGQKHSEREAGSIGGGGRAGGRVAKGLRMAGRMGGNRVCIKNLKIIHIDEGANEMIVSGAVPGARGALLEIVQKGKKA